MNSNHKESAGSELLQINPSKMHIASAQRSSHQMMCSIYLLLTESQYSLMQAVKKGGLGLLVHK